MSNELTKSQTEVLNLIKVHIQETGMPPTRAEISQALGFKSHNAAEQHLKALAKKGYIEMMSGASRRLKLVEHDQEEEQLGLPIVGRVAAGSPVLALEHIDHHVQVPADLFYPPADYLLKVKGLSMKDIGILEDDLLAVHQTSNVKNGDIVVARLEDDVTVKRFEKEGHIVRLIAENPDFEPIVVDLRTQHLEIEGISVGIIRNQGVH